MAGNVGCFVRCSNPAIGQCPGFKESCGQFYCQVHSKGKLCLSCAERKKAHESFMEYFAAAENIYSKKPFFSTGIAVFL